MPVSPRSWRATAVSVSAEDEAAGVKAKFKQDGPKLRAVISSPVSREVQWQVRFVASAVQASAPPPVTNLKVSVAYHRVALTWDDGDAESYHIVRSDGVVFTCSAAALVDFHFCAQPYRYSVAAVGWDGTLSPAASIEVTPPAEIKLPPRPPLPTVYLDAIGVKIVRNGWGKAGINKSVGGRSLGVEGKRYPQGLGLHAPAIAVCPIPGGASRFVAVAGLDDEVRNDPRASVTLEVYGDAKEKGEQPVLLGQSPVLSAETIRAWNFNIELNTRFKELRLVVTDAGDGIAADHADWVDAGFIVVKRP